MRSFRGLRTVTVASVLLMAGSAMATSQMAYELELDGDNHGGTTYFTSGDTTDGQVFAPGSQITWAVQLDASGTHSQPGHPSDGFGTYGAANVVFDIELYEEVEGGNLATDASFLSDWDAGKPSTFALVYNVLGNGPGSLIDPQLSGGPYMEVFTYPTAEPGKLVGMGAGYKEWRRSSNAVNPGVGSVTMPNGFSGYGVLPVAEGQIDTTNMAPGTYVLKVKVGEAPDTYGNNILRGDLVMTDQVNRPAFAVEVNETASDTITFVLDDNVCTQDEVIGRYVYYKESVWHTGGTLCENMLQVPACDESTAIAPDKEALLPGGTATTANYTSYSKGLNGVIVDICSSRAPTANDFQYQVGNDLNPSGWTYSVPAPSVQVQPGPIGGSYRVILSWQDNEIQDEWLRVTVKGFDLFFNDLIPTTDYFYFGHALGETGTPSGLLCYVNAIDESGVRANYSNYDPANQTSPFDINRDGRVNALDESTVRGNYATSPTGVLGLITVP